jgi:hypothetical protein
VRGEFDEILGYGAKVRVRGMAGVEAVMQRSSGKKMIELLSPLFGGCKMTVSSAKVVRA